MAVREAVIGVDRPPAWPGPPVIRVIRNVLWRDPERRFLTLIFGGVATFVLSAGLLVGLLEQRTLTNGMVSRTGAVLTGAVAGHLERGQAAGRTVYLAAAPTNAAWWTDLRSHLTSMPEAKGVHALDASGTIVNAEQRSELGARPVPASKWKDVQAGRTVEYFRPADRNNPDVSGKIFGVILPASYPTSSASGSAAMNAGVVNGAVVNGAIALEMSAEPLLAGARNTRDHIMFAFGAFTIVVLALLWLLIRYLPSRSLRDCLTGLPNRRSFEDAAAAVLARNQRYDRPCALLRLDVNRFQDVNDSIGSRAADSILRSIAPELSHLLKTGDYLARVGGDEFALLLDETDLGGARQIAERASHALSTITPPDGQRLTVSASIGIASSPQHGSGLPELLRNASTALHNAKQRQVLFSVFDPVDVKHTGERLSLEAELRTAIKDGGLHVHYQPIVTSAGNKTIGYEALARWTRPAGPVSPARFIPLATSTGLIRELDLYVYRQTLHTLATINEHDPNLFISVNLSSQSLATRGLPEALHQEAQHVGVHPRNVILEITESAAVESLEGAIEVLEALRRLGFRIALDDFGTGYSSLAYLRALPIQIVKLDRQFISGIGKQLSDETLIQAVIAYAGTLNLQTLAEGAETEAQHHWLQQRGIDYEQGYLHGRPASPPPAPLPT